MSEQEKKQNKVGTTSLNYEREENTHLKKLNHRLTVLVYGCLIAVIALSTILVRNTFFSTTVATNSKIDEALNIMSKRWYFAKDIENIDERLLNQALTGITNNEEDPHTYYMSSEEVESFVQSINRNFVGIGVQFVSYTDGLHMIQRVFKDSPAEKAGVLPGDIIHSVDGTIVDNMSSDNIADLVKGTAGTSVHIEFIREGEIVALDITRAEISATVYGEVKNGVGYLEILQFGETTASEAKGYLQDFIDQGITKLIIDLRDDGGGYLSALQSVGALFLDEDSIALKEEYASGEVETLTCKGEKIWNDDEEIILLVNGNTASAAEAFTLALKEQRDNVVMIGTTTYGKGTVQVTDQFSDGSAIKYTTSKWLSSKDVWVNGVGITPDEIVEQPDILNTTIYEMEEGTSFSYDSVSESVSVMQKALDYLDYAIDRTDGYFSEITKVCLETFQDEHDLEVTGVLDKTTYESLISAVTLDWSTSDAHDTQLQYAMEVING